MLFFVLPLHTITHVTSRGQFDNHVSRRKQHPRMWDHHYITKLQAIIWQRRYRVSISFIMGLVLRVLART